jgi:hypothetical protein
MYNMGDYFTNSSGHPGLKVPSVKYMHTHIHTYIHTKITRNNIATHALHKNIILWRDSNPGLLLLRWMRCPMRHADRALLCMSRVVHRSPMLPLLLNTFNFVSREFCIPHPVPIWSWWIGSARLSCSMSQIRLNSIDLLAAHYKRRREL